MAKNAYLLISDMHRTNKKKENRINYANEMTHVDNFIISCIEKYRTICDHVYMIFLGDIYDSGYREVFSAIHEHSVMLMYDSLCDGLYSLVGNHELTYYTGNPFYTLFNKIESEKVQKVQNKVWAPKGSMQILNVVDYLHDGDVVFHFNHYATELNKAIPGKTNIGLFHQSIICADIVNAMQTKFKDKLYGLQTVNFDAENIFDGFIYNFFGHMHKVFGEWDWTSDSTGYTSRLCYLGSLGRPNRTEVLDNYLTRDIPAVLVQDGHYSCVEHNYFDLLDEKSCIKFDVIKKQQENYKRVKERKALHSYSPVDDEPLRNILARCNDDKHKQCVLELLDGNGVLEMGVREQLLKVLR